MDGKEIALYAVAVYLAVMALVRIMNSYRQRLLEDFQKQVHQERELQKSSKKKKPTNKKAA